MRRFFWVMCILPAFVFSAWGELFNENNDPVMAHHVNVITGRLQLGFEDHVVKGAVPLSLLRSYTNYGMTAKAPAEWQLVGGWSFFPQTHLYLDPRESKFMAHIKEPSGKLITYIEFDRDGDTAIMKPEVFENQRSEVMSYRLNSNNHRLHVNYKKGKATLYLANGGKRTYQGEPRGKIEKLANKWRFNFERSQRHYLLQEEVSSSGQKTVYKYPEKENKVKIQQVNPANNKIFSTISLKQIDDESPFHIRISTSDRKNFDYRGSSIDDQDYLAKVTSDIRPMEQIAYNQSKNLMGAYLETITLPDRPNFRVEYYLPKGEKETKRYQNYEKRPPEAYKVKAVFDDGMEIATFSYTANSTDVRDRDHLLTRYYYQDGVLISIEYFDKNDALYSSEQFVWDQGNLVTKALCDGEGKAISSKTFSYDEYKNVIKETLYGNLTGLVSGDSGNVESYSKWYKYDERHLRIEEKEEGGPTYQFEYLEGTDLLVCKRTMDGDEVLLEESYQYDDDLLLIEKRCFAGYRESIERYKRDPHTGMIIEIDDGLQKIFYTYDKANQIIKEETEFSSISIDYDYAGRIKSKTFPLGGKNEYVYDVWGSPIEIKEIGSPRKQIYYDNINRPIACEMNGRQSKTTYDKKGRVVLEVDYKGGTTKFEYDDFGRCTKKQLTLVLDEKGEEYHPEFEYRYDLQGNVIFEKSPNGAITRSSYNAFKKPVQITQADGSEISNIYYKNGELKETIHQDLTKTTYEYDVLHRLVAKRRGSLEEKWEYEGALLKSYTNEAGLVTTYGYDEYGRKIEESCEGRKKEFFYDELGYLHEIREGELYSIQVHDIEGRVIEVSENGFNKVSYTYDIEGRKTKATKLTSQGEAVDAFFYDDDGRLISHLDPLNQETGFHYEDHVRTEIDPLGNRTIERFDGLSRIIQKEKQSKEGETLLSEKFFYDRGGNIGKRLTEAHNIDVLFVYDIMGRLVEERESGKKRTISQYDIKGRLSSKILPNGTSIDYSYDDLDRLIEMKSSDGTVWHEYIYNGVLLTEIKDNILRDSLKRTYTRFGELAEEIGFSGFKTSWTYDNFGRTTEVHLPDKSSIRYSYQGSCMESVSRYSKTGEFLYAHKYTKFDPNRHVEEEHLIAGLGVIHSKRDLLERPFEMVSPYHKLELAFGPTSLVTESANSLTENKDYSYDALSQLAKEGDSTYKFDSLGNPTEFEINDLNQIVSTPTESFTYDPNGNLIKRDGTEYVYDALNRLREIVFQNSRRIVYTYDQLSRLVSKEVCQSQKSESKKYYVYDREFEIGSMDEQGNIQELKVLGLGIKGDIGAAIALELNGERFLPLHDLQGNIVAILDENSKIVEVYNFTAFGEEDSLGYINPWRFASKREEEGLLFYGRRFYDPTLMRWLSPDPLGFVDSRNLYLYVLNSPLNRLDQFGLESESFYPMPINGAKPGDIYSNGQITTNPLPWTHWDYVMPTQYIGRASFSGITVDMILICSRKYEFSFTDDERVKGYFNLIDHLPELLHGVEDKIAIVTYQNGINTTYRQWIAMGHMLAQRFPKGTLILGIYNPTNGVIGGALRTFAEKLGAETYSVSALRAFHTSLLDLMETHAPNARCLHIPHSEAGAIYNRSFEGMHEKTQLKMQNFFYCEGIGPAESIPKEYGINPRSTYSRADFITGWFASKSSDHYDVRWVEAKSSFFERTMYFADHPIAGSTYKGVLDGVAEEFNSIRGFYVGNQR